MLENRAKTLIIKTGAQISNRGAQRRKPISYSYLKKSGGDFHGQGQMILKRIPKVGASPRIGPLES